MKSLLLVIGLLASAQVQAAGLVVLTKDKASYAIGEKAVLRARVQSRPDNSNLEFELLSKVEGVANPIRRLSEYEFFSVLELPTAGIYRWRVDVYLQDRRLARDLKIAINQYSSDISSVEERLAGDLGPGEEAALLAEKSRLENLKAIAEAQLVNGRTKIGDTAALNIQAQ